MGPSAKETIKLDVILHEIRETKKLLFLIYEQLNRCLHFKRTTTVRIKFGDNMPSTSITETVNQSVIATAIPLEADGVTATPGAVLSSVVWTLSNPGVVEQTVNPDNTASFKALTPGTVTVNVTALVTDADGTATTLSATNTITVTAPTERTASLQINFGVPA